MLDFVTRARGFLVYAAILLGLFVWLERSGWAAGGQRKSARVDPKEIRSSSPGSWTYVYWAHGSRGK